MTMRPLVSVLLSTYNGSRHLDASIQSILSQTYRNLELVIIDDGSDDGTAGLLAGWAGRDSRVRVLTRERGGLTSALNLALAHAGGAFIARQDDDDKSDPARLAAQAAWLEGNPSCGLVGCGHAVVGDEGIRLETHSEERNAEFLERSLRTRNHFCHGSLMARREIFSALGGYREKFLLAQDYDLVLRALERTRLHILPGVLYEWRSRSSSLSVSLRPEQKVFALLAKFFARERSAFGRDSYGDLEVAAKTDLEGIGRFLSNWRMRRAFVFAAARVFAGSKGGRQTLLRLGLNPILADLLGFPKRSMGILRSLRTAGGGR